MTSDDDAFTALLEYVEAELSFATSHYNDSYLDRRVSSRMRRTGSDSYDEYFETLRTEPEERRELLDAMSINVTGFFRNPDVWEGIRDVLRALSAADGPVHVWSAACADGREPYSLSMLALDDPAIDASDLHVLATDINEGALEVARTGVYEASRTVDIADQLSFLDDYREYVDHDEAADSYRIGDEVKENVTFDRHDLINDDPKSGFDLVVCRNLFIYIDNDHKQSMLETIARSIRREGYLVIGKAETIPPDLKSAFTVLDGRLRIYEHDPRRSGTTARSRSPPTNR